MISARHILLAAAALLAAPALAALAQAPDTAPDSAQTEEAAQPPAQPTIPATLMLSIEDMIAVENAIAAGPLARSDSPMPEDPALFRLATPLYVSSIVYAGPASWTVWINGHAFRPGEETGVFDILHVGPESVMLAIPWGKDGDREVTLAPHQTFIPRIGTVVEGRWG